MRYLTTKERIKTYLYVPRPTQNSVVICPIIGCGDFASNFVELFKAHPNTEKVYVCELIPENAKSFSVKYGVEFIESFEAALKNNKINCITNFTRRHQHGDLIIRALKAGKYVYSAVPMASAVEECSNLLIL